MEEEILNKLKKVIGPDNEEIKRIVCASFFTGFIYFHKKIDANFIKKPIWKYWTWENRINGTELKSNWNANKINKELKLFSQKGKVSGSLSNILNYIVNKCSADKNNQIEKRTASIESVGIANDYVLKNITPFLEYKINSYKEKYSCGIIHSTNKEKVKELLSLL